MSTNYAKCNKKDKRGIVLFKLGSVGIETVQEEWNG
jgi:hypothetical protein